MIFRLLFLLLSMVFLTAQTSTEIEVGKFTFQALESGSREDAKGVVILLHGFPETSDMWRPAMKFLSEAGYYCMAPDQRGYSAQARPTEVEAYAAEILAQDVFDIADALGIDKFHLVGHDWGSAVGWGAVYAVPDRVLSWTAMSVPHIRAFADAIKMDKDQKKKSSYMSVFQRKRISEWLLRRKNFKLMREEMWYLSSEEQLSNYLEVFGQEGALRGALNWYRANYKSLKNPEMIPIGDIVTPTLMIWGAKDVAINRVGVDDSEKFMKGVYRLEVLEDAGHWLMQEAPDEVSRLILQQIEGIEQE